MTAAGIGLGVALASALFARELVRMLGRQAHERVSLVLTLAVRLLALAFTVIVAIVAVQLVGYLT